MHFRIVLLTAVLLLFSTDGSTMETLERGRVKVHYSGDSRIIAERLIQVSEESYAVLKQLFGVDNDMLLEVYWADKNDWFKIPQSRYKTSYGMPHMTKGTNHKHYVILPAANVDMPDQLVNILEPMFNMSYMGSRNSSQLIYLLMRNKHNDRAELRNYLSSQEFYVDYLINIVHIHEVMHNFCFETGMQENYGRDNRQAWWVFEGAAQWSVLWVHRALGNKRWASVHKILYRWIYRSGKEAGGNISPVKYSNYAWFHGALVEMFSQLEEQFGEEFGMSVFRSLFDKLRGSDYLTDEEVIKVFSEVAGKNLDDWFGSNWGL